MNVFQKFGWLLKVECFWNGEQILTFSPINAMASFTISHKFYCTKTLPIRMLGLVRLRLVYYTCGLGFVWDYVILFPHQNSV
jgi:hypothetical protein